nr:beta-tubulin [Tanacetum cinerariifolium]
MRNKVFFRSRVEAEIRDKQLKSGENFVWALEVSLTGILSVLSFLILKALLQTKFNHLSFRDFSVGSCYPAPALVPSGVNETRWGNVYRILLNILKKEQQMKGHYTEGAKRIDSVLDVVKKQTTNCDSL